MRELSFMEILCQSPVWLDRSSEFAREGKNGRKYPSPLARSPSPHTTTCHIIQKIDQFPACFSWIPYYITLLLTICQLRQTLWCFTDLILAHYPQEGKTCKEACSIYWRLNHTVQRTEPDNVLLHARTHARIPTMFFKFLQGLGQFDEEFWGPKDVIVQFQTLPIFQIQSKAAN